MKNPQNSLRVAIVYDRVNKWGGAERVLTTLNSMFPNAPLYTTVCDTKKASWAKVFPEIKTTFLQKIPILNKYHEFFSIFIPIAFEQFDFSEYDLVISVTSEFAKGIITSPNTFHLCYCLTPTRYLWSGYDDYFKNPVLRYLSKPFVRYLKTWDAIAANRPDQIISISKEVKKRVEKYYQRKSDIIYPPMSLNKTKLNTKKSVSDKEYFLVVSRLVGYKKVDLVVKAFNKLSEKLVIVGSGWQKNKLKLMASNNIKFLENITDDELSFVYKGAKALIMPQYEDFGLVSIEAQSFGVPVIAYSYGGALDTVVNRKTGVLFNQQNVDSLLEAIAIFAKIGFNHNYIKNNAKRFTESLFKKRVQETLVRINFGRRRGHKAMA